MGRAVEKGPAMTAHILHIGTVCGHPVRFFKTPNDDGRPDFPWLSIDDLQQAVGMSRSARRFFLHKLRKDWGDVARTIATTDGLVTIAPHFVAQGLLDALVDTGMALSKARSDYDQAGTNALQKLVPPHLQFPSEEWLQFIAAAMKRHEKAGAT
jgi:hypothetical protein